MMANQLANDQTVTLLIFKIKPVHPSTCKIKVTFKDRDGDTVKEKVHMYRIGEAKEILLTLEKLLIQLGTRYNLFEEGKWEKLCRVGARALISECNDMWVN